MHMPDGVYRLAKQEASRAAAHGIKTTMQKEATPPKLSAKAIASRLLEILRVKASEKAAAGRCLV